MIIRTKIHGIWLEFLETEVKATMRGVRSFMVDRKQYGTGLIVVDVDESDCDATYLALTGESIDLEFDIAIRRYIEHRWGHRV